MNNNYYNIPENWYNNFTNQFDIYNDNEKNLTTPKIALERGNLFNNLYNQYKNYQYYNLKATNKKEELLYNILKYKFAMNDIELYLDVYPKDQNMINLYNKYLNEEKKICNEYEKNFGALTLDSDYLKENNWVWLQSNWPWEGTR